MLFFLSVAARDVVGHTTRYTDIRHSLGDDIGRSLHTTYKILLEPNPSNRFRGLGWVYSVENPHDRKEKFLYLTQEGWDVIAEMDGVMAAYRAQLNDE